MSFYVQQKPADYLISKVGATYCLQNGTTGALEDSDADAAHIINQAIAALASGGLVHLKSGIYSLTTDVVMNTDYVTLEGEGWNTILRCTANNQNAILIGADGSLRRSLGIRDLMIDVANGVTGCTGILQWRCWLSQFENIHIEGSSAAARLPYGWVIEQESDADASNHSWDNFMKNIRILNFSTIGLWAKDWEDVELTNFNFGTQHASATDCLKVSGDHFNAGGTGVNVSQGHLWGDAANTADCLHLDTANSGTFGSRWSNLSIEGAVTAGIHLGGVNVHRHNFCNIHFYNGITKATSIVDSATGGAAHDNHFTNITCATAANGSFVFDYETGDFGHGWATYTPAGYAWNGRQILVYNSHADTVGYRVYSYINGAWRSVEVT